MNSWRWNELEDEALESLPPEIERLYLRGIRKHMDYGTGITGVKRRVCMDGFMELLNYYPPIGSKEKPRLYSRQQITRMIDKLESAGLLIRLHRGKGVKAAMEFKLPLACNDEDEQRAESGQSGASNTSPHGYGSNEDRSEQGASKEERATSGSPVTPNPLTTFEGNSQKSPKKYRPKKWGEPIDHEIAEWMGEIIDQLPGGKSKRNITNWANTVRLMRTKDEREPVHIKRLFEWASGHKFWQGNIHSPDALREQWKKLAIQCNNEKSQGNTYANRPGTDEKRANQDRIAAMLSDPNDTSWIEGLFPDEESGDLGTGQPGVYETGSDLSQDMAECVFEPRHGEAGKAGGGYIDGEVVNAADDQKPGHGAGANQGRGQRVAAERGAADCEPETSAGGFWNA